MKIAFEFEVEPPTVPNFLIIKDGEPHSKTEGPKKIAVKDLSQEQSGNATFLQK